MKALQDSSCFLWVDCQCLGLILTSTGLDFETWMLEQNYSLYQPCLLLEVMSLCWPKLEGPKGPVACCRTGAVWYPIWPWQVSQDLGMRGMETGCARGTGVQLYRINSSWCWEPSHTNILTWIWNVWSEFVQKVGFLFCVFSHIRSGIYPAPVATTSATLFILSVYSRQILDKSSVCHREGSAVVWCWFCPPLTGKDTEAIV